VLAGCACAIITAGAAKETATKNMVREEGNIFIICIFPDMGLSYCFSLELPEFGNDLFSRLFPVMTSIT